MKTSGRGETKGWKRRQGKAGDGIRTHDNHVGNVVLYQLSYTRTGQDPRTLTPSAEADRNQFPAETPRL
jgi:hypothetical protein